MRIPFASLAYPHANPATWKLLVMRNMTRDQRYRMFSGQVTRESNCNLCYAEPIVGLKDLPSGVIQLRNRAGGRTKRPSCMRLASKLSSRHSPSTRRPIERLVGFPAM